MIPDQAMFDRFCSQALRLAQVGAPPSGEDLPETVDGWLKNGYGDRRADYVRRLELLVHAIYRHESVCRGSAASEDDRQRLFAITALLAAPAVLWEVFEIGGTQFGPGALVSAHSCAVVTACQALVPTLSCPTCRHHLNELGPRT